MRLFTSLDLPEEVIGKLRAVVNLLRPTARIKWSSPENLHITTKFIGEWPEERVDELKQALGALPVRDGILVEVQKVGFFPNPHQPRVFWAGIKAPPELARLARETEDAAGRLGVPREQRPFSPHLTLARIPDRTPVVALREAIAQLPSLDFGAFHADRFCLYHSRLTPAGSVYTKLSEFPFQR